jgi:PmbA protein
MEQIIKICQDKIVIKGIKEYEIYAVKTKKSVIQVKDRKVEFLNLAESKGLSLRVLNEHRLGFAYITDMQESALEYIIDQALTGSKLISPDSFLGFPVKPKSYPQVMICNKKTERTDLDTKIQFALEMEAAAKGYAPSIKKVRQAQFQDVWAEVHIKNHTGLNVKSERTLFSGSIMVMAEEKGEAEMGWHYAFNPFFNKLNPQEIGQEAARLATEALGAKPIPTQKTNVILTNQVTSEILNVLSSAFLGDEVQKGKSLLAPHLGKTLMSPQVTIYDNGLYPEGYATRPFDDEGIPQQKTCLVENGVIKGFLYDNYTAAKENKHSTGNAGRMGLEVPPQVEVTNFYLKPLSASFIDLLKGLYKGLVVTDVLGMHTADPISGDFSVGVAGYCVEKGGKTFPVKGIAMAGNVVDLFKNITDIGNDLHFFGHCGAPSILVEGVQVSGY